MMNIKIRRLIATAIDFIIFGELYILLLKIVDLVINIDKHILLYVFCVIVLSIVVFNIFLRKDTIFGHRSIGKK